MIHSQKAADTHNSTTAGPHLSLSTVNLLLAVVARQPSEDVYVSMMAKMIASLVEVSPKVVQRNEVTYAHSGVFEPVVAISQVAKRRVLFVV